VSYACRYRHSIKSTQSGLEQQEFFMIIKRLRQRKNWSQEQLSVMSGLSLRTIQRIESGNKASLESLKSLAAVFEVDISTLEQEIMTIDKESPEWKQNPFWLRALFWGSNKLWLQKRTEALIFEAFIILIALVTIGLAIFHPDEAKRLAFSYCAIASSLSAYLWGVLVRLSDKYSIWQTGS
jgi:transcriptional regulator with XRE-family HTH domain